MFVGHVARLSGGEIALLNLLRALGDQIEAVVVLAEDGPLIPLLREAGAEVVVLRLGHALRDAPRDQAVRALGAGRIFGLLTYVWRLRRLLADREPDFVHTNTLKAALYGGLAGRLAHRPVIWHVRDRIAPDYLPGAMVRLVRAAARVVPDVVIANSASTLDTLPARAGRTRGVVRTVVRDVVRDMAPASVPPPQPGLAVGIAGRLAPWKGQDLFLRAFAEAFAGTHARAIVIGAPLFGEHAFAASLRELVAELGIGEQTEFRGFRADMPAEYARLDLLVHASTVPEPFGQVVVEGMSAGLCVLAADEGGPREFITDGVDGVLVPPRSVGALAGALRHWATDEAGRTAVGTAARESARRMAAQHTTTALLELYRRGPSIRPRRLSTASSSRDEPSRFVQDVPSRLISASSA